MAKRFYRFLTSLKFGIFLLIIVALYSIIGTVLPQGMAPEFYQQKYPAFGQLIVLLQFTHVYQSLVFRILLLVLVINLVGCTANILPAQIRRLSNDYFPPAPASALTIAHEQSMDELRALLKKARFQTHATDNGLVAAKHRIGSLGSSVTHLGILIIILGAFFGSFFIEEGFFNMLPGEHKDFPEYGFALSLDDFYLSFREDGGIDQYYSDLSVYEAGQKIKEAKMWVNQPLSHNGLGFFQSTYGWASVLLVKDAEDQVLHEAYMRDGDEYFYQPEHLSVYLYGFFPDFAVDHSQQPLTKSQQLNNPYYAVVLYQFGQHIDSLIVEPGQAFSYKDLSLELQNPRLYTGITYRRDSSYFFVMLGSGVLLLGLFLSFYLYPKYLYVFPAEVVPVTRQNAWGFSMYVKNLIKAEAGKGE